MSIDAARTAGQDRRPGGDRAVLASLIDWPALRRLGWDPGRQLFAPAGGDPVFGFAECRTVSCDQVSATSRFGLCDRCLGRWRQSPAGTTVEEFCDSEPARPGKLTHALCLVCRTPGHERPVHYQGLCGACASVMGQRGQSVAEYITGDHQYGPAVPRASFGRCKAAACQRWAHHGQPALCASHYVRWISDGRRAGEAFGPWCTRQRDFDADKRVVDLAHIGEQARLEVLYGLQCRARAERRTTPAVVQMVVNLLQDQQVPSVFDLPVDHIHDERRLLVSFIRDRVTLALASPETEVANDDWDLRVFGRSGEGLHFGQIRQAWLKEAAKHWARERLATAAAAGPLERVARALGVFSESLRRHRIDRGDNPAGLSRADVLAFSGDLAHLEAAGRLSRHGRRSLLAGVAQLLSEARGMGLARPGGPLAGLPEDVTIGPSDRLRPQLRIPIESER